MIFLFVTSNIYNGGKEDGERAMVIRKVADLN